VVQEAETTVVHQIMNELPQTEVGIISQDSYYKENHGLSFDERALIILIIRAPLILNYSKHLKLKKATTSTNPFIPL
jgi:uridine kinase